MMEESKRGGTREGERGNERGREGERERERVKEKILVELLNILCVWCLTFYLCKSLRLLVVAGAGKRLLHTAA